jgi:putative ABC transport system ATP-binding protein
VKTHVPVLETRGLSKRFGDLTVLHEVSLKVARGESLAVMGPSGSGKSTLLGLLAGLEAPSAGSVLVEGTDITGMDEERLAAFRGRRMGFIFQSYRLLPTLSALENVRVPLDLAGDRRAEEKARAWLDKVGLAPRLKHLPGQLSGGEQQRVALARALAPEPAILLADEPTGNLDSRNGALVEDLLFGLVKSSGASMVLVTHDARVARKARRVVHFKDGRVRG